MKEHHRTDRLTVTAILLFILIAIGLFTYNAPKFVYKVSPEEALKEVEKADFSVSVKEAKALIANGGENTQFVDIRNRGDYVISHIEGAVNIPIMKLLEKENVKLFKDKGTTFVLYGADQYDADNARMLLRQIGFENFKVLLGGYANYKASSQTFPDFYATYSDLEKPVSDFTKEVQKAADSIRAQNNVAGTPTAVGEKPAKKKKKAIIKKAAAEAEEEGC